MASEIHSAEVVVPLVGDPGRYARLKVDIGGFITIDIEDMSLGNEILALIESGRLDSLVVEAKKLFPQT